MQSDLYFTDYIPKYIILTEQNMSFDFNFIDVGF